MRNEETQEKCGCEKTKKQNEKHRGSS